ncbi:MAG TPA: peptide-methionine (R)-S-oxide reductase MsrB [Steroidobacteraceae bacterium]|nr:peptide-methionine (R)-S-oxide reductase MsrB [Steroidobacteraceae bacterium]
MAEAGRFAVEKSEEEWRRALAPRAFAVLRKQGTEPAGSSALNAERRAGTFSCAGCAQPLFAATAKYDSGTGWPSFYQALPQAVATREDYSHFMRRTEVHCAHCGGHLGHLFTDGPQPSGTRYCLNGVALAFEPQEP